MALQEQTFKRDLKYSNWHRPPNLPDYCKAWNIDYVEVRNNKIVAFIEISDTSYPIEKVDLKFKKGHKFVLSLLTELTKIPSYIVFHNSDLSRFKVFDLQQNISVIKSETEYKNWLIKLPT